MNILDIDPNPQLSVYTGIRKRLILLTGKLGKCLDRALTVLLRRQHQLAGLPFAGAVSPPEDNPTGNEIAPVEPEARQHLRCPMPYTF